MSIDLMRQVYEKEISAKLQRVLLILCDHANPFGKCYPSLGLMAWELGLNERTIRRAIDDLEAMGVIAITRKNGTVNHYDIDLSGLPSKPPYPGRNPGQNVHASQEEATDKMSTVTNANPGQNVHRTPDILSKTPDILSETTGQNVHRTIEPSKEPPSEPTKRARTKHPAPAKACLIPDDFTLTDDRLGYALKNGLTEPEARMEFEMLRNWAEAKGERKSSWDATWRTWVLRHAKERSAPRAVPSRNGQRKDIGYTTEELIAMARGDSHR